MPCDLHWAAHRQQLIDAYELESYDKCEEMYQEYPSHYELQRVMRIIKLHHSLKHLFESTHELKDVFPQFTIQPVSLWMRGELEALQSFLDHFGNIQNDLAVTLLNGGYPFGLEALNHLLEMTYSRDRVAKSQQNHSWNIGDMSQAEIKEMMSHLVKLQEIATSPQPPNHSYGLLCKLQSIIDVYGDSDDALLKVEAACISRLEELSSEV